MERPSEPLASTHGALRDRTYVIVWGFLVCLTLALVALSRVGQRAAVAGLLTITPVKAALVLWFFMHLRAERPLVRGIVLVALATLLVFVGLLFTDVASR